MKLNKEEIKAIEEGMEKGICKMVPNSKVKIILPNDMKIIPFRIKASKEEDNYSDVYAFLIQGTKKDAYEIEIDIDSLNDLGITDSRCTCPHFTFRGVLCKHIKKAKEILVEHGVATDTIKSTNVLEAKE